MSRRPDYGPPPNARIDALLFDAGGTSVAVTLRGDPGVRTISPADVSGLTGARIRHEQAAVVKDASRTLDIGMLAATTAMGMPVIRSKSTAKEAASVSELHHAVALRIGGVAEIWYMLADSFNFRKALGPDAGYASEMNLRMFVKKLAAFAPGAAQDAYVGAIVGGKELPPPLDSLIEFLRAASRG